MSVLITLIQNTYILILLTALDVRMLYMYPRNVEKRFCQ